MGQIQIKRRQKAPAPPVTDAAVRAQLAWAAGAQQFEHRDPLYHVTESFQQTFDWIGKQHAQRLGQQGSGGFSPAETPEEGQPAREERQSRDTSAQGFYQAKDEQRQQALGRFSETAFQRGNLAGAVIQGTGKMMLVSCLKRTVGQSQPQKEQQKKLFEGASQQRNVPGHSPDQVIFNRGFAHSAVGLVVDTLRDARRTVDSMADLAQGKSEMGCGSGADTLRTMYPFLDDSRERGLLEQYRQQLRTAGEGQERAALQNATARMEALIEKKAQMKLEFTNKLRFLSDRATEALEVFSQPGFSTALDQALREALGAEEPPPLEGEGGGDGAASGPGAGAPDGTETGPEDGGAPP